MEKQKLRAWWSHKQGLDGSLSAKSPAEILETTGWSRSVGGANPYLALFARGGFSREQVDSAVAKAEIHELPSARGCTYVLPAKHFALGLTMSQGFSDSSDMSNAVKHFGLTIDEIEKLESAVVKCLSSGTKDPKAMKDELGGLVRNFGEEGKKRGVTTTLPIALGRLQTRGLIRRVPVNGRIDQQRYAYTNWKPSPMEGSKVSKEEAIATLARLYFQWIGPASLKGLQWFSGLGVKAVKDAVSNVDIVPIEDGSNEMVLREDLDAFRSFEVGKDPCYSLVGSIDNISHLRLGLPDLIDQQDADAIVPSEKSVMSVGSLSELASHGIYDRGRLVGVWEYDPEAQEIAWKTWRAPDSALREEVEKTEKFVREHLADARTFSLDSPESRKPRLAVLRG